jgi:hypothetical protein
LQCRPAGAEEGQPFTKGLECDGERPHRKNGVERGKEHLRNKQRIDGNVCANER